MTMSLSDNLNFVGKRAPIIGKYKVNSFENLLYISLFLNWSQEEYTEGMYENIRYICYIFNEK